MTRCVPTLINDRWTLLLPEHRASRPEWPTWEKERLAAMHDVIRPGDVVIDVGAEEGDLPGLWASWGARVVLFEPNPLVWPNIRAVWEANGFPAPAGWFVGFASDCIDLDPAGCDVDDKPVRGWPRCAYGPVIGDHGFRHLAQEADRTPQVTLDHWCRENAVTPDVITIDVEGSELRVLHGAARVLTEHRPVVFVSVHTDEVWMDENYGSVDAADVDEWMAGLGYRSVFLALDHERHVMYLPEEWP